MSAEQRAAALVRPPEVSESAWAQMSDATREEVRRRVAELWYERVGKYWTDEQWVKFLATRKDLP